MKTKPRAIQHRQHSMKALLYSFTASLFLISTSHAQIFQWTGNNGSWNTTGNWNPAGPPDGVDNTITSVNPGGGRTITLDGDHTIGNIAFTVNANRAYTINAGTPSTSILTLEVTSGTPSVSVVAGATSGILTVNAPVAGTQGLSKTGVGIFVLGGINTLTGPTSVSQGWLGINGSLASGAPVNVNSGGNLAGTGIINDSTTLNSGGNIDPGGVVNNPTTPQVGTLTLASLLWNGGGKLTFELGDPSSSANSDLLNINGAFTKGSVGAFSFTITPLTGFSTSASYTLINFGSQSGFSLGDFSGAPSGMQFDLTPSSLMLTPIPEPSAIALAALGGLLLLNWRHSGRRHGRNLL